MKRPHTQDWRRRVTTPPSRTRFALLFGVDDGQGQLGGVDDDDEAKVVTLPRAKKGTKGGERERVTEGGGPTVCSSWEEKGERERARAVGVCVQTARSFLPSLLSELSSLNLGAKSLARTTKSKPTLHFSFSRSSSVRPEESPPSIPCASGPDRRDD